ncbi:pseudouridine synthase [Eubacterium multiforme]|uniref:Pseudouridine synthase n=1 Tax=Eubacterium multiforme TaxID=83339 RepID=A0ABT9USW7_9FIRM|nr:pseudouridine synthase [Eubacterium multiforme]MDQ0149385.1 16S rRNA pseudouridine516 synthase [Eubacterium multiforme]
MRLDKFLAQGAIGKRKEVRIYIKEGKVKVNEKITKIPAIEINEKTDTIKYLDKVVPYNEKVYYIFNKPAGYITAKRDSKHKTVFDFFNDKNGIFHVGRLDKDTEGLLLFTNDGEFEHKIMYPEKHINKTYFFWALGFLSEEDIKSLEEGVYIGKGEILTKPSKMKISKGGLYKDLKDEINNLCNIDLNYDNQKVISGYLTISEGRKNQVKRMLKTVGCYVVYLKRISIGGLMLDETLRKGEYRDLTKEEIKKLFEE